MYISICKIRIHCIFVHQGQEITMNQTFKTQQDGIPPCYSILLTNIQPRQTEITPKRSFIERHETPHFLNIALTANQQCMIKVETLP